MKIVIKNNRLTQIKIKMKDRNGNKDKQNKIEQESNKKKIWIII